VKTVPLGGKKAAGRVALVDDEDYDLVSRYRWHVWVKRRPGRAAGPYAQANVRQPGGHHTTIRMHCLILGRAGIDHRNGDGLDNTRANLRIATTLQNGANQQPNIGTSSAYKGISWNRRLGKWQADIQVNGQGRYLGVFLDEEAAARAYDAAALDAWGEFALLNFPSVE
jgi:hypothetical protein